MSAAVTSLGNEGFLVEAGGRRVFIDAFYGPLPGMRTVLAERMMEPADLILVSHAHWDHFDARGVTRAARRTGATVVGPSTVTRELPEMNRESMLVELEPPLARGPSLAASRSAHVRGVTVRAFRTLHSGDHNSYLVELPGFRFFHDGDNEDTRRIDCARLGRLDALLIGPWQGSGYVEFIERLSPRRWFLMHLSLQELEEHQRGTFLTKTCGCDRIPPGLVALWPGETFEYEQ